MLNGKHKRELVLNTGYGVFVEFLPCEVGVQDRECGDPGFLTLQIRSRIKALLRWQKSMRMIFTGFSDFFLISFVSGMSGLGHFAEMIVISNRASGLYT